MKKKHHTGSKDHTVIKAAHSSQDKDPGPSDNFLTKGLNSFIISGRIKVGGDKKC